MLLNTTKVTVIREECVTSYQEFVINLLVHFLINEPVPQADQCLFCPKQLSE